MDRATLDVYEARAAEWEASRRPRATGRAAEFATAGRASAGGRPLVDLGCGPGWSIPSLGAGPTVALDGARAMLDLVPGHAPGALRVQADLTTLPFRRGSLGGAWASKSYVHLARAELPLALWDLHRSLAVGTRVELTVFAGDQELAPLSHDDFPGRSFSLWSPAQLRDVLVGAGFDIERFEHVPNEHDGELRARLVRARTLADTVGPGMRLLVVGLNPSIYAADAGVGFARPGNRFWPAILAAGLVHRDRDPRAALVDHGIGMTDLVKRATARADELDRQEYRDGFERVSRLVGWLRPGAVCVVGLSGWRVAVDRRATPGWQDEPLHGVPVYVMPNTSGLNARTPLRELTSHLVAAATP